MHQIYRASRTTNLLQTLIITVAILSPALSHPLNPAFSNDYNKLIASARGHAPWWMKCHGHPQELKQICLQYVAVPQEDNRTSLEEASAAGNDVAGDEAEEEHGWSEVLTVMAEEAWKVALEIWREWMTHFLREEETQEVNYSDNYASLNGGAIVIRKSSQRIHKAESILEDSSDKYLCSDEQLPIEVIIALKEEVKIERISIRSNEVYSSIVKEFQLQGALNLQEVEGTPKSTWSRLLSATAKNSGAQQSFRSKNKVARFLRLRIISKYGDWKYFTLTQLKVYGEGLFTEALVNLQTVHSTDPPVRPGELQLAKDLGFAYQQLINSESGERQEENVLSFLLQKVGTLSKIHEFELFYMQNLSMRLENVSRLERQFLEHKNQYIVKTSLFQKYQQRKVEQKLADLQALGKKLVNQSKLLQELRFADLSNPQVCPNKQQELQSTLIQVVIIVIAVNLCLSSLVAYCCFRYFRKKEQKTHVKKDK